jgi:hypothetical protein
MRTFASIRNRSTWITGRPHGPWGGSEFRVLAFCRKREAGIITVHLTSS